MELSVKLKSSDDLSDTQIYKLFNDEEKSWAFVSGNYNFGVNTTDIAILIRLAKIGCSSNVPFISYIQPEMFDIGSFDGFVASDKLTADENSSAVKLWKALRSQPEATHLGLSFPRFLTRLPYGEKTEPTEVFCFKGFTANSKHENYLWTNPIFICCCLLAQSFKDYGWNFSGKIVQDFDGLPVHFYQEETQIVSKPCAEITMTQNNAEFVIEQGLIHLISYRDSDRLRVGRFQSPVFSESMIGGKSK